MKTGYQIKRTASSIHERQKKNDLHIQILLECYFVFKDTDLGIRTYRGGRILRIVMLM